MKLNLNKGENMNHLKVIFCALIGFGVGVGTMHGIITLWPFGWLLIMPAIMVIVITPVCLFSGWSIYSREVNRESKNRPHREERQ